MTVQRIAALLHEAAETHHTVYRITDGTDPDWASWYAEWLITLSELPALLGRTPVRSHLVHALVDLERTIGAEPGWELGYAEHLIDWFGPEKTRGAESPGRLSFSPTVVPTDGDPYVDGPTTTGS